MALFLYLNIIPDMDFFTSDHRSPIVLAEPRVQVSFDLLLFLPRVLIHLCNFVGSLLFLISNLRSHTVRVITRVQVTLSRPHFLRLVEIYSCAFFGSLLFVILKHVLIEYSTSY